MSQKYVNTKTLLKDVVFEEAHGLMAGSSTGTNNANVAKEYADLQPVKQIPRSIILLRGIYWG